MPYLIAIIALGTSLLSLRLSLTSSSTLKVTLPRYPLSYVDFYSVRIATLLPSSLAIRNKARSSAILSRISFLYRSLVETVVDADGLLD